MCVLLCTYLHVPRLVKMREREREKRHPASIDTKSRSKRRAGCERTETQAHNSDGRVRAFVTCAKRWDLCSLSVTLSIGLST